MEPVIIEPSAPVGTEPTDINAVDLATPAEAKTVGKSPTRIALTRLRRDRTAMVCLVILGVFVLIAVLAPLLAKLEGQDAYTLHQDLVDRNGYPFNGPTG